MEKKQIAEAFSGGKFERIYPFLADNASWNIVGDKILNGKDKIISFCGETAKYFLSVTAEFTVDHIIVDGNCVAIDGTAIFINKDNNKTFVSSCDIYRFVDGKLAQINSYCITTDKE